MAQFDQPLAELAGDGVGLVVAHPVVAAQQQLFEHLNIVKIGDEEIKNRGCSVDMFFISSSGSRLLSTGLNIVFFSDF